VYKTLIFYMWEVDTHERSVINVLYTSCVGIFLLSDKISTKENER
jgi:hypothetical protein